MEEKNYRTLRDALDALPDLGAPAGAWDVIERGLTPPLADRLPSYRPPAEVWNGLSQQLDSPAVAPPTESGKVRRMWPRIAAYAAAALVVILAGVGLLGGYDSGPTITYAYTQEPAPAPILNDWAEEEESFARITAEIETRNEPALNTLHHELAELTEASQEVQAMLVAYGDDPKVVRQLAEIERDRSDIYRRIIVAL